MSDDLKKLQETINYNFDNTDLLKRALTHKSYAMEASLKEFNERMEFLGDSILSAVVSDYLYHKYPDQDEGRLSQLKSQVVSRQSLSQWARKIKLGNFMYISKGEDANGGRKRDSLLSNTFEALIAAIFLDSGMDAAGNFVRSFLLLQKRLVVNDAKSKLQEQLQAIYKTLPEYKLLNETGLDHVKTFEIGVFLKKNLLGVGTGFSKKEAERIAAKNALKTLSCKK